MPPELYRRARRAEAGAERAEDRRRRRLDFFRGALAEGFEALKRRHAEGASGEDSVRTYARFMDDLVGSLAHLASGDAEAAGLAPTPFVLVALGGYGRGELHPSSDIDLMIVYESEGDTLGVERFMRDYYLNARAIHRVSQRLIARCHETLWARGSAERRQRQQALADGLVFFDGRLHRADRDPEVLRRDPVRLMKVFWHLHRLGCDLSLGLERAVEESLDVVDDEFRRSPAVRDLFLDICRSWGRVALTFSEMHELGLLGRYLHDFGKAKGHGHVAKGIPLIRELTARMGLPPEDAGMVEFLVAHHLTMSHIAQRRDIDDPKTIETFAETVADPQRLRMLYLLTWADMRAVGPGVLTGWQARILHELYARTLARLTGGRVEKPNRTQLAARLWETLGGDVPMTDVRAHLAMVQNRYLATTSVQRMAAHLRLVARLESTPVATELFHHPDLGSSDLVVVTRDVVGLFSLIAGTLAAHGVNIISAQIATRADGVAIDTFQVNDPTGEAVTSAAQWGRALAALAAVLTEDQSVDALLERRRAGGRVTPPGETKPKITVDNRLSDEYTVIEVKCPDRLGLLYLITRTLSALDLDIASARIATEIDQAFDTFYVLDRKGRRLEDPAAIDQARTALEQALLQPI